MWLWPSGTHSQAMMCPISLQRRVRKMYFYAPYLLFDAQHSFFSHFFGA